MRVIGSYLVKKWFYSQKGWKTDVDLDTLSNSVNVTDELEVLDFKILNQNTCVLLLEETLLGWELASWSYFLSIWQKSPIQLAHFLSK